MSTFRPRALALFLMLFMPVLAHAEHHWQSAQCAANAGKIMEQMDEEAACYVAELRALGLEGAMFDIQVRAFEGATPELRAKMWNDLEITKQQLATPEMQELLQIRKQMEATPDYDEETLRYKAALENAGKTDEEIHGLVTLFSISNERIREALWNSLKG